MKVLFGIQLNGNGHATRSALLIRSLIDAGAEVDVITSGNNSQVEIPFPILRHYEGLTMHQDGKGSVDWYKTLKSANVNQFIKDIKLDVSSYDVVVSDFEPITAWSARKSKVKSFGFGNQYAITLGNTEKPKKKDYLSELFIKRFARCGNYIPLTYQGLDGTYQPIVEKSLFDMRKDGDFTLIYMPSISTKLIVQLLSKEKFSNHKFKVYGKEIIDAPNNIEIVKVGDNGFKKDLAECECIITAAGFSTTSEALALGKKVWSIPVRKQYEQICNAIQLKKMGVMTDGFHDDTLSEWLDNWSPIEYKWKDPTEEIVGKILIK